MKSFTFFNKAQSYRFYLTPVYLLLLSTLLYFSPILFSQFDNNWNTDRYAISSYSTATIALSIFVISVILALALALPQRELHFRKFKRVKYESVLLTLSISVLGAYTVLTPGMLSSSKVEVLLATNRFHFLFYNLCMIGAIFSAITDWKKYFPVTCASAGGLLLAVYIGHRSYLAISFIAILYLSFRNRSLFSVSLKVVGFAIISLFALMLYKPLYSAIKDGNIELILYRISPENLINSITIGSEQFITYAIFDQVVISDFEMTCSNLLITPLTIIPFLDSIIDLSSCSFNNQFQGTYFSDFSGGVAANIWAEFYSNFGIFGLVLFIFTTLVLCLFAEKIIKLSASPSIVAGVAIFIVQLTFYVQRNEFMTAFLLGKRAIMSALIVFAPLYLLTLTSSRISNSIQHR